MNLSKKRGPDKLEDVQANRNMGGGGCLASLWILFISKIPDCFYVVWKPMDLGTIKSKLLKNVYIVVDEFAADLWLNFTNAMRYNPLENWVTRRMGKKKILEKVTGGSKGQSSPEAETLASSPVKGQRQKETHVVTNRFSNKAVYLTLLMQVQLQLQSANDIHVVGQLAYASSHVTRVRSTFQRVYKHIVENAITCNAT
ncbi:unnamed protein product [Brassica oleracea var. botrytis]|uniref:Bromo domain-containing protein n=1 Tax=Brassica oleracea TaxID=3712 RepID=A0A3P6EX24_BRAOL|nr:unnamed protein product [Brassica oleracea]